MRNGPRPTRGFSLTRYASRHPGLVVGLALLAMAAMIVLSVQRLLHARGTVHADWSLAVATGLLASLAVLALAVSASVRARRRGAAAARQTRWIALAALLIVMAGLFYTRPSCRLVLLLKRSPPPFSWARSRSCCRCTAALPCSSAGDLFGWPGSAGTRRAAPGPAAQTVARTRPPPPSRPAEASPAGSSGRQGSKRTPPEAGSQPLGQPSCLKGSKGRQPKPGASPLGQPSCRSRAAAASGRMSLAKAPMPDSDPARYFSFPGARLMVNSSRCSANSARPARTGAWCQPEM
jgi:hypothetical protein